MRLFRFGPPGAERPGVVGPVGALLDASGFGEDWGESFLGNRGLERLAAWLGREGARAPRLARIERFGPPIVRPSKIVGIGLNYLDHAQETKSRVPAEPVIFLKASSALAGPDDDLPLPPGSTKLDYEVELAVVIGRSARAVPVERALEHVAGFAVMNDVSERAFQLERGGQWSKGKSADGFAPMGPHLVTPDEVGNFRSLDLWLAVNGEPRQSSNTGKMIFDVPALVSYVSGFMTLLPGDVITTGTPAGVGLGFDPPRFLKEGDVVELGIDGLGRQRQRIVARRAPA